MFWLKGTLAIGWPIPLAILAPFPEKLLPLIFSTAAILALAIGLYIRSYEHYRWRSP